MPSPAFSPTQHLLHLRHHTLADVTSPGMVATHAPSSAHAVLHHFLPTLPFLSASQRTRSVTTTYGVRTTYRRRRQLVERARMARYSANALRRTCLYAHTRNTCTPRIAAAVNMTYDAHLCTSGSFARQRHCGGSVPPYVATARRARPRGSAAPSALPVTLLAPRCLTAGYMTLTVPKVHNGVVVRVAWLLRATPLPPTTTLSTCPIYLPVPAAHSLPACLPSAPACPAAPASPLLPPCLPAMPSHLPLPCLATPYLSHLPLHTHLPA